MTRKNEFESLTHQHLDALYTRAIELEAEMPRVEILVQDTVLKAFELFASFRQNEDFKTWLLSLLDDIVYNQRRHRHAARAAMSFRLD